MSYFFVYFLFPSFSCRPLESTNNFEKDIQRILKEQEIVTKRSKQFENKIPTSTPVTSSSTTSTTSPTSPLMGQPVVTKVGFAAVQEMARLQEDDASRDDDNNDVHDDVANDVLPVDMSDLSFLRFDPDFNRSPVATSQPYPSQNPGKANKNIFGKFPLEIPTPVHSPKVGLKRFGSFR